MSLTRFHITIAVVAACGKSGAPSGHSARDAVPPPLPRATIDAAAAAPTPGDHATVAGIWDLRVDHPETFAALAKRYAGLEALPEKRGAARRSVQIEHAAQFATVLFPKAKDRAFLWFESDTEGVCAAGACVGAPLASITSVEKDCKTHNAGQTIQFTCVVPSTPMLIVIYDQSGHVELDDPLPDTVPFARLVRAKLAVGALAWVAPGATWASGSYDEGDR